MKKILIVCNYFAPDNRIASVRPTKFAKYLSEAGYHVTVLAEKTKSKVEDDLLYNEVKDIPVYYAEEGGWCQRIEKLYQKITCSYRNRKYEDVSSEKRYRINPDTGVKEFLPFEIAYPVLGTMDYLIKIMKQKSLYRSMKKWIRQNKNQFDVCFSTYGSYFGHYCGLYFKKINPNKKWIADFRDNVYNFKFNPPATKVPAIQYEKKVYQKCDEIIVVTKGLLHNIPLKFRTKVACVTNGYDLADRRSLKASLHSDKFSFCYTGIMYGGLQKLNKLFEAVRELSDENKINLQDVEFHYAGSGFSVFESQARESNLEQYCINHGQVPHRRALELQMNSVFLVVSAWAFKEQYTGILTGKALEYMSAGKPIIALTDGNAGRSELSDVIREGNFGCAYDAFHDATDFDELKKYIYKQYQLFKQEEKADYNPNPEVLERFDYRSLTRELIEIIEK